MQLPEMEVVPQKRRPYSTLEKIEMKKSLVALAALASVSSFAQTSVTLSGNMDVAGVSQSGTQYGAKGSTFTTGAGTASTSVINLIAVEDLGGGMKVTAKYGLDPRSLTNDGLSSTNMLYASNLSGPNAVTVTGLGKDEVFLGIEGDFGSLKLGAPNAAGVDANGISSPLGTGVGSGYGATTKLLIRNAFLDTRYDRSVRFDTPRMSGLKASVVYAPGNDEAAVLIDTNSYAARNIPNARRVTELGLNYANGPLNVQFVNFSVAAASNALGYYAVLTSSTASYTTTYAYVATKTNTLAANYNLGNTTVYGAIWSGDSVASTTAVTHTKGARYAVKQTMGATDVMLQYTQNDYGNSTVVSSKVLGARVDYNLSKTAKTYIGYESWDTGTVAASTNTTSGTRKITSIGLQKSF